MKTYDPEPERQRAAMRVDIAPLITAAPVSCTAPVLLSQATMPSTGGGGLQMLVSGVAAAFSAAASWDPRASMAGTLRSTAKHDPNSADVADRLPKAGAAESGVCDNCVSKK